jgi:hypothetical protein
MRDVAKQGKMQDVDVKVDDVEFVRAAPHFVQHHHVVGDPVAHGFIEPQGL